MTAAAPENAASGGNEMTGAGGPELRELYDGFAAENLTPLWTQRDDLMPPSPAPRAAAHVWRWHRLYRLAQRAGDLVPVGRGGERRAIALANPGLGGAAYATPTLWAAIQYLGPKETAPEHRHAQNAFRFVVEGEGVWTVVNGDPVRMSRGDLLLTPGWHFHGHHNETDQPMAWLDGLDIPFSHYADTGFFEFGSDRVTDYATPNFSRSERLWGHPGLRPLSGLRDTVSSPIAAYRWEHTDRALTEQLLLEEEGQPATVEQGHAAVRYVNPTTGGDVMPTIRAEFHRLRPGAATATRREVGSSVFQVVDGEGHVTLGGKRHELRQGDLFTVPSWVPWSLSAEDGFDLFRFSDAPVMERLHVARTHLEGPEGPEGPEGDTR
ncbi:cupin domain-containing protein [Streptomyces synnematoformans]|uniref:Cupin domain-containing protein n=1 Tax=Streptomyces synnematoformans TaxID=415721 RepID=A0ABN2YI18_9ACTN